MHGIERKRYFWVSVSALIQGLLLAEYANSKSFLTLTLPLTLVVTLPFSFWLAQEHWGRRLWRFLAALTGILAVFYAYWLWSVFPTNTELYPLPAQNMALTRVCITVFLFLPFFQCRIATWSWRVPYSDVFFQLCRNVFLLFQAAIVTAVFWALLLTASLLFDIIGLNFIPQVLFNSYAAFPLTSLTVALSITVALKRPGIDSLGRWILAILAWLLPPFSLLSAVFVASLPFSGLRSLWDTGQASSLMLLLQFATILLANAAWLDGTRVPFPNRAVSGIAKLSLLCLPVYTALCLYSLGLRIQQYGWSADRIQAVFFVVVAGVWGIGYAGIVLLCQWPAMLGRVNVAAAVILAAVTAAMNSPLLDPYRLSADNQMERLLEGRIHPENFDFLYLRFNLGRYGNYALARLMEREDAPESLREQLSAALSVSAQEHWADTRGAPLSERRCREILAGAKVYPEGRTLSPQVVNGLVRQWTQGASFPFPDVRSGSVLFFVFKKVALQSEEEQLLLFGPGRDLKFDGLVFDVSSLEPRLVGTVYDLGTLIPVPFLENIKTSEPRFKDLLLNGGRYPIVPTAPR